MCQLSWVAFFSFFISFCKLFPSQLMALVTCPFVYINSWQNMTHCPSLTHYRKKRLTLVYSDDFEVFVSAFSSTGKQLQSFLKVNSDRKLNAVNVFWLPLLRAETPLFLEYNGDS